MKRCSTATVTALVLILGACGDDTASTQAEDLSAEASTDLGADRPGEDLDAGTDAPIDAAGDPDSDADSEGEGPDLDATGDDTDDPEAPDIPPGPPVILLTIDELPAHMNGSIPYMDGDSGPHEFTLALPTYGFTLDVMADRPTDYLDDESLEVTCDVDFGGDEGLSAGANLAAEFTWGEERIDWLVPLERALDAGPATCQGRVANLDGELSEWSEVTFEAMIQTDALHPFRPADVWVVSFSRDRYDVQLEIDELGTYSVIASTVEGGNGQPDFLEDLGLLGLRGEETGQGAAEIERFGQVGANAVVTEWIIRESMRQARGMYGLDPDDGTPVDEDSVQLTLYREGDEGAPDPTAFDGTYSIHGVGGDAPPDEPTQFGRASAIDVNNESAQDDSRLGYGSFTTSMARQVIQQSAGRFLLRDFLPGTGIPVGESDLDATILAEGFEPRTADISLRNRYNQLAFLVEFMSKALAALIAHEMGHSLGLVACGPPPSGLFGGVYDPNWMESDPGCAHIDTPGLNIMQTGGSLLANPQDIQGDVSFNPLNLAYLRGRLLVVPSGI